MPGLAKIGGAAGRLSGPVRPCECVIFMVLFCFHCQVAVGIDIEFDFIVDD